MCSEFPFPAWEPRRQALCRGRSFLWPVEVEGAGLGLQWGHVTDGVYLSRFVSEPVFSSILCATTIRCKLSISPSVLDTETRLSHMVWFKVKQGQRVNARGLTETFWHLFFFRLRANINPKVPPYYIYFPSPSSAAFLLLSANVSMCPQLCTHHMEASSFTCPAGGVKHLHSRGTPTQAVTLILTVWTSSQHCESMSMTLLLG